MSALRRPSVYLMETRYELIKLVRLPFFLIPALGFPVMFYIFFGLVLAANSTPPGEQQKYLLATFGAYGVIGLSLFGLGIGLATERGQGWLTVKRASPMPMSAYFLAKYTVTLVLGAALMGVLCLLAATIGHVHMQPAQWLFLVAGEVVGAIPFCAIGITIGYLAGPNSAAGIINAIYLPMAFLSGLFLPITMLPKALQSFAPFLPPYHLAQLGLSAVGDAPAAAAWRNVAALIAFGLVFTATAIYAYRKDEGKTYG